MKTKACRWKSDLSITQMKEKSGEMVGTCLRCTFSFEASTVRENNLGWEFLG